MPVAKRGPAWGRISGFCFVGGDGGRDRGEIECVGGLQKGQEFGN